MDERWEQLELPALIAEVRPDVYLSLTGVLPAVKTCAQVTVIHDAGVEEEPGFYPTSLWRYLTRWLRAAALQADRVVTVSQFARSGIERAYGIPAERTEVIPPAAEGMFQPVPDDDERRRLLSRYRMVEPYLITVAAAEPNKNLPAVLEAYRLAGGKRGTGHRLALAGGTGGAAPALQQTVRRLGLEDEVWLLGYVTRDHLPSLYSGATCFLWASLYEGFGLPPLEAMACGTPVISSERAAMPEVLGEAAMLVDPTDPRAMGDALGAVLSDRSLRERMREAGLERARSFSWHDSAARMLACLARVASAGS
jgi:glycosyltransferase involved in cell wall biosynthesis